MIEAAERRGPASDAHAEQDRIATDLGVLAGVTDRGLAHERNEDAMALGRAPDGTVAAVVCDGVSSSLTPERASRAAADTTLDVLLTSGAPPEERVRDAVVAAKVEVSALGVPGDPRAPSCTLVCALVRPDGITVGWVGDSRAYRLTPPAADEPSRLLTADHSWAAQMIATGMLDEAAAMRDRRAHAITRWIGAGGSDQAEVVTLDAEAPGALLLCSDGLWNYLPDAAALAAVALPELDGGGPIAAAHALTELALDAGGRDNITVVLVRA